MHITTALSLALTILTVSASPAPTFSLPASPSLDLPSIKPTLPSIKPTLPSIKPTLPSIKPTLSSIKQQTLPSIKPTLPSIKQPTLPSIKPTLSSINQTLPDVKPTGFPTLPVSLLSSIPVALPTGVGKLENAAKAATAPVSESQKGGWKCPASNLGAAGNNVAYKPACCDYISGCLGNDFTALECYEAIPVGETADKGAGAYTCDLVDGIEVTRLGNSGCCSQIGTSTKYECVRVVYT